MAKVNYFQFSSSTRAIPVKRLGLQIFGRGLGGVSLCLQGHSRFAYGAERGRGGTLHRPERGRRTGNGDGGRGVQSAPLHPTNRGGQQNGKKSERVD